MDIKKFEPVVKRLITKFGFNPFDSNEWVKISCNPVLAQKLPSKYKSKLGFLTPADPQTYVDLLGYKKDRFPNEVFERLINPLELEISEKSKYLIYVDPAGIKEMKMTDTEFISVICQQLGHLYHGSYQKKLKLFRWYHSNNRFFLKNLLVAGTVAPLMYLGLLPVISDFTPLVNQIITAGVTIGSVILSETIDRLRFIMKNWNIEFIADSFCAEVMGDSKPLISIFEKIKSIKDGKSDMIPSFEMRIEKLKKKVVDN